MTRAEKNAAKIWSLTPTAIPRGGRVARPLDFGRRVFNAEIVSLDREAESISSSGFHLGMATEFRTQFPRWDPKEKEPRAVV